MLFITHARRHVLHMARATIPGIGAEVDASKPGESAKNIGVGTAALLIGLGMLAVALNGWNRFAGATGDTFRKIELI